MEVFLEVRMDFNEEPQFMASKKQNSSESVVIRDGLWPPAKFRRRLGGHRPSRERDREV